VKARKKAMDADVVVVNHHLFLADMVGIFGDAGAGADIAILRLIRPGAQKNYVT
jgi:Rad3-related DNA helicase